MSPVSTGPGTPWAFGGLFFGATMLVLIGVWQVLMGIATIAADELFVVSPDYAYEFGTTVWGWLHLIIGGLVLLAGFALYSGALLARLVGVFFALLAAVANFFFLPYYPLWSLVVIGLSILVVWALATAPPLPGRRARAARQ